MAALPVLSDLDLTKHEIQNASAQKLAADPGSPVEGLYYWHTGNKEWRVYNGTAWVALGAGSLTGVLDSAEIDFSVAAGVISGSLINGSVVLGRLANIGAHTYLGNITAGAAVPVALTRTQLLGDLAIVPGDIGGFDTQVRISRLDQMAVPTADLNLNTHKITGLVDGTAATDAATFGQLNAILQGQTWKAPVRAATTASGTLASSFANGQVIDGVTLATGDRILIKDQATASQNGIYIVAASGAPTRATDMDVAAEFKNSTVLVQTGTANAGDTYTETATVTTVNTDTVTFTKTGEGNTVYGADGTTLTLTGTTFSITAGGVGATQLAAAVAGAGLAGGAGTALSVNVDTTTLEINADTLRIAAGAAGAGLTGGAGSALAVGAGTGISVAADTVGIDTAVVVRKFAADIGNGSLTSIPVTHGLGTKDIEVQVRRNSDDALVLVAWVATSTTVVTLDFGATAPTTNQYRVMVQA